MLAWGLRGTRGVRTRYVCTSCCDHVFRTAGAHGRGAPLARTYATRKKPPKGPPGASTEDGQASDSTANSKTAQPSQTAKSESQKKRRAKNTKHSEKPASPKKKTGSPSKAKTAEETEETVKLLKETLDILKNLQHPQDVAKGSAADQATPDGDDGKKGGANAKRSLKSHFPPLQSDLSDKDTKRQAMLLEGTLDIIKSVLTIQAEQRHESTKPSKTTKIPSPTTKTAHKQTANKGAKQGTKTSAGSNTETSKPTSEAAALQRAAKRVAAAREAVPGAISLEKGSDASETDHMGAWGLSKSKRLIKKVRPGKEALQPIHVDTAPVPKVEYGLDRVLFNEGVYVLQDPRTRVFNFDPYLATIMPVKEFDFDALKQYVTSSKDTTLIGVAKKHNKKFTGSTSSMTATLAHFHYLLSSWRPINAERISKGYKPDSENFGAILRAPAATFLHYKDGTYAIDADKEYDSDTVLSMLGKSMEKLLTAPKEEYEKYRRSNSHQLTEEERNADESYHYTTFGDFMMRSQLDAYDPRLPGTGVFDLKTRAVVSIRMDAKNHEKGSSYEIRHRQGQWESFEREYYDMIRLAFLKYSLQVRMGRMDGIFVAYHNTQRIFGFQYIPLEEMDLSLHGTTDLTTGNREFMASLELWEELLKKATERFPGQSLRVHVETRPSKVVPFMYFFAEPVNDGEIKAIQEKNKEEAQKFQERVLGIKPKPDATTEAGIAELVEAEEASTGDVGAAEDDAESKQEAVEETKDTEEDAQELDEKDSEDVWEDMMHVVEQTMESDAQGISAIRDAIEDALEQSGLLHARSSEEADRYVEALLNAIVDVDAEKAKSNDDAATEVSPSKSETPCELEQPQDVGTTAQKPSRLGFLSRWFGSGTEADATASKEPTPDTEPDQKINVSSEQEPTHGDVDAEGEDMESKPADEKSDDSLKDLLIKLTTCIGSSSDAQKATEELSEDQAKLRNFESILLDMMPKTQETAAGAAAEEDAAVSGDEDRKTSEDMPGAAGNSGGKRRRTVKPVLGLILTIRNKVDRKYVQRPVRLTARQDWVVEYTIEELAENRVQEVYKSLKKRRHTAHYREPDRDVFKTAFDGMLKHYSRAGKEFRQKEIEIARNLPVHVVGQDPVSLSGVGDGPPTRDTRLTREESFAQAVELLKAEGKKPINFDAGWDPALRANLGAKVKSGSVTGMSLNDEETVTTGENLGMEENTAAEATEKGSSSFRQWREENQQKQDTEKEQEQKKEKDP
jgi:hypothetical protein